MSSPRCEWCGGWYSHAPGCQSEPTHDRVLGIDPAGAKLAFAWLDETGAPDWLTLDTKLKSGPTRLAYWRAEVVARPHLFDDVVFVVVELPWANQRSSFSLLSTAAVLLEACAAAAGCPVMEMTTGAWKKASVGRGNAQKPEVMEHARGLGYGGDDQDVADALCMCEAGWALYRRSMPSAA